MNFKEAIEKLSVGEKVRRKGWPDDIYVQETEKGIHAYRRECVPFQYDISIVTSNEWQVMGEEEKYVFPDAIPFLLYGKKIRLEDWPEDCYLEASPDKKDLYMYRTCEYPYAPAFSCFTENDWIVT